MEICVARQLSVLYIDFMDVEDCISQLCSFSTVPEHSIILLLFPPSLPPPRLQDFCSSEAHSLAGAVRQVTDTDHLAPLKDCLASLRQLHSLSNQGTNSLHCIPLQPGWLMDVHVAHAHAAMGISLMPRPPHPPNRIASGVNL